MGYEDIIKERYDEEDLDNIDEGVLLRTIRIPKNIIFLSDNLPEKNYEKAHHIIDVNNKTKKEIYNINKFSAAS